MRYHETADTYSMQYALFHPSSCCMYTAVSVCITKLTKLKPRKKAAYVYFFLVANFAWVSGLRLRIVDLLEKVGRSGGSGDASYPVLPLSSSSSLCNKGW
jgi:hypothetical protein